MLEIINKTSSGERNLHLKYEIGGPELVYTGLDGDEFHSKVHWDGNSLIFDTVEHERGREIVSKQIWTLENDGSNLREVKQGGEHGKGTNSTAIFEKSAAPTR